MKVGCENIKKMKEMICDESNIENVKQKLVNTFQRRIDQIDIERFRLIQRIGYAIINVIFL